MNVSIGSYPKSYFSPGAITDYYVIYLIVKTPGVIS